MAKLIREHMAEVNGEAPLGGKVVEVDETFVGGKSKGRNWRKDKTVVMGMMERNGDVMLKVVEDQTRGSLVPHINDNAAHGTEVHTTTFLPSILKPTSRSLNTVSIVGRRLT